MTSAAQPGGDSRPDNDEPAGQLDSELGGRLPLLTPAEFDLDHAVGDDLYAEALGSFGTEKLIALVNVVGRYMNTATVLACFRVPAPPKGPGPASRIR